MVHTLYGPLCVRVSRGYTTEFRLLFVRRCWRWPRTSRKRKIRCSVYGCGWSIQYRHERLCRIPDTGEFLEQVSRRSRWICAAHASSEPLLSCFARRGQCLCWLCYARQVALEPGSPRFQHLCQRKAFQRRFETVLVAPLFSTLWAFPLRGNGTHLDATMYNTSLNRRI